MLSWTYWHKLSFILLVGLSTLCPLFLAGFWNLPLSLCPLPKIIMLLRLFTWHYANLWDLYTRLPVYKQLFYWGLRILENVLCTIRDTIWIFLHWESLKQGYSQLIIWVQLLMNRRHTLSTGMLCYSEQWLLHIFYLLCEDSLPFYYFQQFGSWFAFVIIPEEPLPQLQYRFYHIFARLLNDW